MAAQIEDIELYNQPLSDDEIALLRNLTGGDRKIESLINSELPISFI